MNLSTCNEKMILLYRSTVQARQHAEIRKQEFQAAAGGAATQQKKGSMWKALDNQAKQ